MKQEVENISKDVVKEVLKRAKSLDGVDTDNIPVKVWKCLGEV